MWLERLGAKLTIGAFIGFFTSYADVFGVLMLFMIIDYITGMAKAFVTKTLNSQRGGIGIVKKFLVLCIVIVAHYLQIISGMDGVELLVLYFFLANEALSILENCGNAGLPLPQKLLRALEQLKGDN